MPPVVNQNFSPFYPKARLSIDSFGDAVWVTNVKVSVTNNGKLVHTLGSTGRTLGYTEATVTMDTPVSEDGMPLPWLDYVLDGSSHGCRYKFPGGVTLQVKGMFTSVDTDGPSDAETSQSITFIGKPYTS
jgi:hypothetical protein